MEILENVSLKPYTSMYTGGSAKFFVDCKNKEEIVKALLWAKDKNLSVFILGGGSNVVFSDHGYSGLVLRPLLMGIEILNQSNEVVALSAAAGEGWDSLVDLTVQNGWYGIENLSLIPGSVGASVVQNIGAYGQEMSAVTKEVHALNLETHELKVFPKNDILFDYRTSRFNSVDKGKYLITTVIIELQKHGKVHILYADLQKYFALAGIAEPTLSQVRQAVITIRNKKFPTPGIPTHGSAGSFFKARPITLEQYEYIIQKLREKGFSKQAEYLQGMQESFKVEQGFKVPYGLLIEALDFKGKNIGGAKILESHAGVINNFTGDAKSSDILKLSAEVIEKVKQEFNIDLLIEPELVGNF